MSSPERYRVLALSAAKHDYVPLAFKDHPRFQVTGVSDEPSAAGWVHECNERLAADLGVPYEPGIDAAIARHRPHVAVVSSEAARHARLSVRAAQAGLHVVQDKPMAPTVADCDAIVEAVERAGVRFLLWNRNTQPAIAGGASVRPRRRDWRAASHPRRLLFLQGRRRPAGLRRAGGNPR